MSLIGRFEARDEKRTIRTSIEIWQCGLRLGGLSLEILDGILAFMDVEDNAAGEESVDHTGQSAILSIGYRLQVPWDDNDRSEISL